MNAYWRACNYLAAGMIYLCRNPLLREPLKPEHIKQWWGRRNDGYSVPVCEVDLRVGGKWRFVNQIPSGKQVAFNGVYHEIARPDRLVFTEIFEEFPDTESLVTSVYTDEGGKTRLTVTARYPSLEVRDIVLKTGMEKGAATSYDRLEDLVAGLKKQA